MRNASFFIISLALMTTSALADEGLDKAIAMFKADGVDVCDVLSMNPDAPEADVYEFDFKYASDDADYPSRHWIIYAFHCTQGAYNSGYLLYSSNDYDEISQLQFVFPDIEIAYENEDDFESPVKSIDITGYYARPVIFFPEFDPQTLTLTHWVAWRGLADAFDSAEWVFRDGNFVLSRFSVDASYDGAENAIDVYPPAQ